MNKIKLVTIICAWIAAIMIIGTAAWLVVAQIGSETPGYGIMTGYAVENLPDDFRQVGSYSLSADEVFAIYIDWMVGQVSISPQNGNDILVTEFAQRELADYERFDVSAVYGIVIINYRAGYGRLGYIPLKQLEVLVPAELLENLERLRVQSISADVDITVPHYIGNVITVSHYSVSGEFSSEIPTLMTSEQARFHISTISGDVRIYEFRQ